MKYFAMVLLACVSVVSFVCIFRVVNHLTDQKPVRFERIVRLEGESVKWGMFRQPVVQILPESPSSDVSYREAEAQLRRVVDSWLSFLAIFAVLLGLVAPLAGYLLQRQSLRDERDRMDADFAKKMAESVESAKLQILKEASESLTKSKSEVMREMNQRFEAATNLAQEALDSAKLATDDVSVISESVKHIKELSGEGEKTFAECKRAIDGDVEAQFRMGYKYASGTGVATNYKLAWEWYLKAAEKKHSGAMNNLGVMCEHGNGVPIDYKKAMEWYRKAAELGNGYALSNIGSLYESGRGVAASKEEAFKWYQKSADKGNLLGRRNLGMMYRYGRGVGVDSQKAFELFEKAAKQGDAIAQFNLAYMYLNVPEVPKNDAVAIEWYRMAASQEHDMAQLNLGVMYEFGQNGLTADFAIAVGWYRKSANRGNAFAMCNLGWMYEQGRGIDKCYEDAVEWYQKAVKKENARAYFCMARMYERGFGIAQDRNKAESAYEAAIKLGDGTSIAEMASSALKRLRSR